MEQRTNGDGSVTHLNEVHRDPVTNRLWLVDKIRHLGGREDIVLKRELNEEKPAPSPELPPRT